jgi:hypothetical protein
MVGVCTDPVTAQVMMTLRTAAMRNAPPRLTVFFDAEPRQGRGAKSSIIVSVITRRADTIDPQDLRRGSLQEHLADCGGNCLAGAQA